MPILNMVYYAAEGGGGWQPGENTVAYYPLDSTNTVNDLSANGYNLSNNGVLFGTYDGVDCAYFNGHYLSRSSMSLLPQGNSVRTVSFYVYCGSKSGKQIYQRGNGNGSSAFGCFVGGNGCPYITTYGGPSLEGSVSVVNQWGHVVITHDGSTLKIYANGQLNVQKSTSLATSGTDFYIGHCTWVAWDFDKYISKFIVENKCWTAQEVSDYYDLTKGDYGL